MTILTAQERRREVSPPAVPRSVSSEELRMRLADAARQARHLYAATLIETPFEDRPREMPDGRVSVTREAWNAHANYRAAIERLIDLAITSDVEGRDA